jgi:hypothetical protein
MASRQIIFSISNDDDDDDDDRPTTQVLAITAVG